MSKFDLEMYKMEYNYLDNIEYNYSLESNNYVFIGFVFSFLIGDVNGSLRYEEDYLDNDGKLFFQSE